MAEKAKKPRKPRKKKAVTNTADRPITEFISASDLAKRLGISSSRLYVLAKLNRLSPPPQAVGNIQVFHETTSYTPKVVTFVEGGEPVKHRS